MPLVLGRLARKELRQASEHYGAISEALARSFAQRVDEALGKVSTMPAAWPVFTDHTHRVHLRQFPYSVIYRIEGKTIRVIAVMHQRREPGYWRASD